MRDSTFLDSNIFLYAFSTKDLAKQKIAASLVVKPITISTQVINEVSSNLIKKLKCTNNDIAEFVEDCYLRYNVVDFTKNIFIKASTLRENYHFSYYDSLIVSSALLSHCSTLYSEDMQHGLVIEEQLTIINPFKPSTGAHAERGLQQKNTTLIL